MKVSRTIKVTTASEAIDLLTLALPDLSKGRLKDAMNKGALSVQKGKQHRRMRRAQAIVQPGEILHLNYDDDLLNRSCEPAELIADEEQYSVWFKPPLRRNVSMLSRGRRVP